ncbi:MAG TPA: hypothetical protein VFR99_10895 [Marmoricola sp.]|nr:hypothetical protein [Marmoricola sp.]
MRRLALVTPALAVSLLLVAGCGETGEEHDSDFGAAADTTTCVKDAQRVSSYPEGFPGDFPFPAKTVVFDAEDRGQDGVVVTGVTSAPFRKVLAALNGPAQQAGFQVTDGETEEHDAEANWTGNGYRGRWAIRESGSCPGETVVQVLAAKGER